MLNPHENVSDQRKGFLRKCWLVAGLLTLVIGGITLYVNNLKPTPSDLQVLGQSEWLSGSMAALHIRLVHHADLRGIGGVPITVELAGKRPGQVVRLAEVTTRPDGTAQPQVHLPEWDAGDYELRVAARGGSGSGSGSESLGRPVKLRRSWQVMLSTDKPVYQPGQVIRMRGLALRRPDRKPVSGSEMVFSVTDPRGNVIFRRRGVTSTFGNGASECPLAEELIEGPYEIECRVGDTTSRATVAVQTYVLPRLKVEVETDQAYYPPGAVVKGRIRAAYVHGKPVGQGEATIVLTPEGPLEKPVGTTVVKLAEDGTGKFECPLPETLVGRPQDSGDARITIAATVRDAAGQSQTRTISRIVTVSPIRIEVMPESGALVLGVPNVIHILTSLPDGRPARARLVIRGIERELHTNELGATSLEFTPEFGAVSWMVEAHDDEGWTGRREVTLRCGQAVGDFLVRTDKAVYGGGESLKVLALGGGSEPVFLDFIRDGQTMLSQSITMDRGHGALVIDLPPALSGTIELLSYRYDVYGNIVHKSRIIYVRPARELTIKTTFDRSEYRPGDRARLSIALTDEQGKPAPGAVSLAAVDEAVFSVLDRRPGLERTFFDLEEELLRPIYEIHDWSPGEAGNAAPAERSQFEQALFARTARDRERGATIETVGLAGGPHTLRTSTFPAKEAQVAATQRTASARLRAAWSVLGLSMLVLAIITLWGRGWGEALLAVAIVASLIALLLPAVQMARESARRAVALALEGATPAPAAAPGGAEAGGAAPARVRQWFPETLLWRPELITDDQGRASLELDLADSITTWRLTASAVNASGRLGGTESSVRVFQPFFVDLDLPAALTRDDEAAVPVVVSNYLEKPQTVALRLTEAPWFERLDDAERSLTLGPGEVRAVHYRIRVRSVGPQALEVQANAGDVADAVKRPIEVVPDGRRVEQVVSGTLRPSAEIALEVPGPAIEGTVKALVKIYPSSFGQLVEGLDAIFQRPFGCFEQTSSTTYPNILALDYLRRHRKSVPEVEARARQYLHLGYQRLLSFEVAGGGFDWFGNPPANRTLTAYGLMEFQDMARVHDVDPHLIARTRRWLLDQQRPDGTWDPEGHMLHEDPTGGAKDRLGTTAYLAWSVFSGQAVDLKAQATHDYLKSQAPETIDDPYLLALVASALLALSPDRNEAGPYLDRLVGLKNVSNDGRQTWWRSAGRERTMFYGAGISGAVETTALASLALLSAGRDPAATRSALAWLIAQKDAQGTWHSTQATVLALKALLAGTGAPLSEETPRRLALTLDGGSPQEVRIPAEEADVVRQIDLSDRIGIGEGTHHLRIDDRGETEPCYEVVFAYHVPVADNPPAPVEEPLTVALAFDRTTLAVDDRVTAVATLTNNRTEPAPMVILDVPIPAGFAIETDDLAGAVNAGLLAKFQLTPRSAILYLRDLKPGQPLKIQYRLRATMPVKLTVPPARAYEYYDPQRQGASTSTQLVVDSAP
jgi:hypothetical protein